MVLKTDENGDEYYNYYDISEQQDETLKLFSEFIDKFLHTIVLNCLVIGIIFFIFLVILWIFSHDICIPCVACFNSKHAWLYNIILCFTCGLIRKPAFKVVKRYCKNDGIFLQYGDYKEKVRKFDEMAKKLDNVDKGLIENVLQSYKYKQDPYRILAERETKIKIMKDNRTKMKTKIKNTGFLTEILNKMKTKLTSKLQGKVPKRSKRKRIKKK